MKTQMPKFTLWLMIPAAILFAGRATGEPARQAVPDKHPSWLDRSVSLERKPRTFDATLKDLSKLLGRTILADGEPIGPPANDGYAGRAKDVLDRIADRFDFTWRVNARQVILLNKRFNKSAEQPQMHLEEMQRMASDAYKALGQLRFDNNLADDELLRNRLYRSLTDEQRDALGRGVHLKLGDLSPEQAENAKQAVLHNALAAFYVVWHYLTECLASAPAGTLYAEVSHLQAGPRIDQTLPVFTVRFLYSTFDGRQIPAIIAAENRY